MLNSTELEMRSPASALRLLEGIEELKQGKGIMKKLCDLVEE